MKSLTALLLSLLLIISLIIPSLPTPLFAGVLDDENADRDSGDGEDSEADETEAAENDAAEAASDAQDSAAEARDAAARGDVAGAERAASEARSAASSARTAAGAAGTEAAAQSSSAASAAAETAETMVEAARAISEANRKGVPVDVDRTISHYADTNTYSVNSNSQSGTVVGKNTGARGNVDTVRDYEATYAISNANAGININSAPVNANNLVTAFNQVANNIIGNTAVIAGELLGVRSAVATPISQNNTVGGTFVTKDAVAYSNYQVAVAPVRAALDKASNELNKAYETNNQQAIDAAFSELDKASDAMKAVAQEHFGVPAQRVSLATGEGATNVRGSGGNNSIPPTSVGGRNPTGSLTGPGTNVPDSPVRREENTQYSYDNKTNTFRGNVDNRDYLPNEVPLSEVARKLTETARSLAAQVPAGSVVVVDSKTNTVSTVNSNGGKIETFNEEGKEIPTISNLQNPIQPANKFTNTNLGEYKTIKVVQNTPVVEVVTGKTNLGEVPETIRDTAIKNGYSITSPTQVVALSFSHEISPQSRAEIISAYKKDPTFKTLDSQVIREVGGIIGAIAGEAAAKNRTVTEQVVVTKYLSSVTDDMGAFTTMKNRGTREALTALAEAMTNGSLSNTRGLGVTAPVTKANHFYASYITPSWADDITNPTEVGKYTKTVVGYIPKETNPVAEGVEAAFNRSTNLDSSGSVYDPEESYVVSVKSPSTNLMYPDSLTSGLSNAELASYNGIADSNEDSITTESISSKTRTVGPGSTAEEVQAFWEKRNGVNAKVSQVNPALLHAIAMGVERFEATNPNYRLEVQGPSSAMRKSGSVGNHGKQEDGLGGALDMVLVNKTTGKRVTNHSLIKYRGELSVGDAAPLYQKLFNETVVAAYRLDPNLAKGLRFGGYFGGGSNPMDLMHIDRLGKTKAMAGGTILGGFTEKQIEKFKITGNNPLGSWDKVADLAKDIYDSPEYQNVVPTEPLTESEETGQGEETDNQTEEDSSTQETDRAENSLPESIANTILEQAERAGLPVSPRNTTIKNILKAAINTAITQSMPLPAAIALTVAGDRRTEEILRDIFNGSGEFTPNEEIDDTIDKDGDPEDCPEPNSTSTECEPKQKQAATAWLGANETLSNLVLNTLSLFTSSGRQSSQLSVVEETDYIPVNIRVDMRSRDIEISRPDIINTLELYSAGKIDISDEELEGYLDLPLGETPVVFGENGTIVYSNGLYSPTTEFSGNETQYVYTVELIDENGNTVQLDQGSSVLGGGIGEIMRGLLSNDSAFVLSMVEKVEYSLSDPDQGIRGDEYYNYRITLKDGQIRRTEMPQYTSVENMRRIISKIGYDGDVLALIGMAEEVPLEESESVAKRFLNWIKEVGTDLFTEDSNLEAPDTRLPVLTNEVTTEDIKSVFIYPNANVYCPNVGSDLGYKYVALVKDRTKADEATMIVADRCGSGNELTMAVETAHDLESTYGIKGAYSDELMSKIYVREEEAILEAGISRVALTASENVAVEVPPTPTETPTTTVATTSTKFLPNLTNTVVMEIKALSNTGAILIDWSRREKITVPQGAQIYLRWEGKDYQQCLPFLQDGGNYALTRKDRTMLSGNTESESYNITERSGSYRVECGGQKNNEYGVDERKLEVTIE